MNGWEPDYDYLKKLDVHNKTQEIEIAKEKEKEYIQEIVELSDLQCKIDLRLHFIITGEKVNASKYNIMHWRMCGLQTPKFRLSKFGEQYIHNQYNGAIGNDLVCADRDNLSCHNRIWVKK